MVFVMWKTPWKMCVLVAAFVASGSAFGTPDDEAQADDNACVFVRSVNDFKPLDRNKLVIWAPGHRDAYLVELSMPLTDLKFAHQLAVVDRNNDGRLCGYGMDRIVVVDSSFREPSTVLGMTRLDDKRIAQLEAQYDVRLTRKKKE